MIRYSVLAREIFNPNYALFISTGDNVTFQPNPQSFINPDHLDVFKFVGRIIGKAICDGFLLDAHFTRSFYKHILGLPVSPHDLEAFDPEYHKTLQQILTTPLEDLCLDLVFAADCNDFGKVDVVDLVPDGRNIPVTDANKEEYVKMIANFRMTSSIRPQVLLKSQLHSSFNILNIYINFLFDSCLHNIRSWLFWMGFMTLYRLS
jgi:E3 ubiquitin-protein ligase HUWE1